MAEGARTESVYTRKCIEGSNPLSPPNSKKARIRVRAFCMVHRREGREASTGFDKTPAFWTANGGPQGERSESSPLTAKFKRKHGFASGLFAWCTDERGEHLPLCGSDPHYRRLSTNFTADFLTHSWHVPCRSPQFSAKCARRADEQNTEIILDRIGPTPIVAPRCSDDFATKNMVRCPSG